MPTTFAVPQAVAAMLGEFLLPWVVCGGWAVDLFLNSSTRAHKDIEVAIFRRDQLSLRAYLAARSWRLNKIINHNRLAWGENEFLEPPIHEIHCANKSGVPDSLEVLLNETAGDNFAFRRDRSITLPLVQTFLTSSSGLPILAPEVALLYKSKSAGLPENTHDFNHLLPHFDPQRRNWLANALRKTSPGHPWLTRL